MKKAMFSCLFLIAFYYVSLSQTPALEDSADTKADEAIKLMDNGKPDEAIKLLEEAISIYPTKKSLYLYEVGYAYYIKEDYKKSVEVYEEVIKYRDDNRDQPYQMLGNAYDMAGDTAKAMDAYDRGLKLYPNSGRLLMEKGNMYIMKGQIDKALEFFEKGINREPSFPSNYFRAANLYLQSRNSIWGMIYGEIFMNLERVSKRTEAISKLMYETYMKNMKVKILDSMTVTFWDNMISKEYIGDIGDTTRINLVFVYEPLLLISTISEREINLASLNRIRSNFIDNYYQKDMYKKCPNVLFSYQKKIKDAGFMEAYNYWLLSMGDQEEFKKWYNSNEKKYRDFIMWFKENPIEINNDNKFVRVKE